MEPSTDRPPDREESDELYRHIYTLSQSDFRRVRRKGFFRKTLLTVIVSLAACGSLSIGVYLVYLRGHLKKLSGDLARYAHAITDLNNEIQRLSASETAFRRQVDEYENFLSNVRIEDQRIVDFDLTDRVESAVADIAVRGAPYENVRRGNTGFKEIALTFDLGTGRELGQVYTVLKRHGVRATVFLSNEMESTEYGSLLTDRNTDYLVELAAIGCEFGNHTWSHYNLKRSLYETSRRRRLALDALSDRILDEAALALEFDRVEDVMYRKTGIRLAPLWRAPYGALDHHILSLAARVGYPTHVMWSGNRLGPLDFMDYVYRRTILEEKDGKLRRVKNPHYFTSQEMLQRLKEWERADYRGFSGAIAISHLGTARKIDKMTKILPAFIDFCQKKGYRFVTVSEVLNESLDE